MVPSVPGVMTSHIIPTLSDSLIDHFLSFIPEITMDIALFINGRLCSAAEPFGSVCLGVTGKHLCKLGLGPDGRTLPVEEVDRSRDNDGKTGEHGRRVWVGVVADVVVHCSEDSG